MLHCDPSLPLRAKPASETEVRIVGAGATALFDCSEPSRHGVLELRCYQLVADLRGSGNEVSTVVTHLKVLLLARHPPERRRGTLEGVPDNKVEWSTERFGMASRSLRGYHSYERSACYRFTYQNQIGSGKWNSDNGPLRPTVKKLGRRYGSKRPLLIPVLPAIAPLPPRRCCPRRLGCCRLVLFLGLVMSGTAAPILKSFFGIGSTTA